MRIDDLEHLQVLSEDSDARQARIVKGQGFFDLGVRTARPILRLDGFVEAYSIPTAVNSVVFGQVAAGQYSSLRVFENVFVRAEGIFG